MFCVLGFVVVAALQPTGRMAGAAQANDRGDGATRPQSEIVTVDSTEDQITPVPQISVAEADAAWRGWMARNGVVASSLAIGLNAEIVHSVGIRRSAQSQYPMASLSKAVTGICLNQLLNDTPYDWASTIGDLQPEWNNINLSPAQEMMGITLGQVATHTSGLPELLNYGTTSTRDVNLSNQSAMTRAALREASNFSTSGSYQYSNSNYAILGTLIEAMSGESYGEYCGARILEPAGAMDAGVTGRMAQTAGYGGWSMSAEDYARFVMYWFDQSQPWMKAQAGFPFDSASNYGMGVRAVYRRGATYVEHTGRWTHRNPIWPNVGSLFFMREDGVVAVVNWDKSLDFGAYSELRDLLYAAL